MAEVISRLCFTGIDILSFAVVGIPMMLVLFLPVLRTGDRKKRRLLMVFSDRKSTRLNSSHRL